MSQDEVTALKATVLAQQYALAEYTLWDQWISTGLENVPLITVDTDILLVTVQRRTWRCRPGYFKQDGDVVCLWRDTGFHPELLSRSSGNGAAAELRCRRPGVGDTVYSYPLQFKEEVDNILLQFATDHALEGPSPLHQRPWKSRSKRQ